MLMSICLGVACAVLVVVGATADAGVLVKTYEFNVDGTLPSADPETAYAAGRGAVETSVYSVSGGLLRGTLCPDVDNPSYFYPNADLVDGRIDPERPLWMEARLAVDNIDGRAGTYFGAFDGIHRYAVWFTPDGVEVLTEGGGTSLHAMDDLDEFHTYRLYSPGDSSELSLFVDDDLVLSVDARLALGSNGFGWGIGTISFGSCADVRWDWVKVYQATPTPAYDRRWADVKREFGD